MKKIAITTGDPGGIGPEIVLKAIPSVNQNCLPLVIGDLNVFEEAIDTFKIPLRLKVIQKTAEISLSPDTLWLMDMKRLPLFKKGGPDAENGAASAEYIKKAAGLAMSKEVDAVVTAPISKEALKLSGLKWPGHTEMLAELTGANEYAMMLSGGPLKVILVTIHTPLKSVPDLITRERVLKTIRLAKKACAMLGMEKHLIAVAGLNPHAGESGIFGDEEIREIVPAIEKAKKEGINVEGPFPPDTIFHKAYRGDVDMVVCMYHDQGLIPLKMTAFDKGVNVTVGLPIIRTSPDHGTAYDIAWKGVADPSSMIEAVNMALRLTI